MSMAPFIHGYVTVWSGTSPRGSVFDLTLSDSSTTPRRLCKHPSIALVTKSELRRVSGLRGASSNMTFLDAGGVTSNKHLNGPASPAAQRRVVGPTCCRNGGTAADGPGSARREGPRDARHPCRA